MSLLKHMERWKDIEGYEGLYQISSCGRVKSLKFRKERILKQCKEKMGYLHVNLYKEGKYTVFKIHRLVANAFLSNPNNCPQVNHKDEVKTNNYVSNLEWCSSKYNNNYGSRTERMKKTKNKQVLCIETNQVYESMKETGVNRGNISSCCNGKRQTAGGYHWKFID